MNKFVLLLSTLLVLTSCTSATAYDVELVISPEIKTNLEIDKFYEDATYKHYINFTSDQEKKLIESEYIHTYTYLPNYVSVVYLLNTQVNSPVTTFDNGKVTKIYGTPKEEEKTFTFYGTEGNFVLEHTLMDQVKSREKLQFSNLNYSASAFLNPFNEDVIEETYELTIPNTNFSISNHSTFKDKKLLEVGTPYLFQMRCNYDVYYIETFKITYNEVLIESGEYWGGQVWESFKYEVKEYTPISSGYSFKADLSSLRTGFYKFKDQNTSLIFDDLKEDNTVYIL